MPVEKAKIEDHGSRVVATAVALICLDILMIASRFLSRRVGKKVGFWWDDVSASESINFLILRYTNKFTLKFAALAALVSFFHVYATVRQYN